MSPPTQEHTVQSDTNASPQLPRDAEASDGRGEDSSEADPSSQHDDGDADDGPSEEGAAGEQDECACGGCDEEPYDVAKEVCESSFAYVERATGCDGYVVYRYLDADRTFTRFISDAGELLAHSSRACQAGTEPPTDCAGEVCTVCLGPGAEGAHASKLAAMCDE